MLAQAYLTTRKQNKKFAVFELSIVFDWRGCWEEDGKEVCAHACIYYNSSDCLSAPCQNFFVSTHVL